MQREEYIIFCKKCINKQFDPKQGLLCKITQQKADFKDNCDDYILDESKRYLEEEVVVEVVPEKKQSVLMPFLLKHNRVILETLALVGLIRAYLIKLLQIHDKEGFEAFAAIAFIMLLLFGFKIYRDTNDSKKIRSHLFAIYYGFAFAFGLLAINGIILNKNTLVMLILETPNIILFIILLISFFKSRNKNKPERAKYFKGLLIRSAIIMSLFIIVASMSFQNINIYLNKDISGLYFRGKGEKEYDLSLEFSEKKMYKEALKHAEKSERNYDLSNLNDSIKNRFINYSYYKAYYGLLFENYRKDDLKNVDKYAELVIEPLVFGYGENSQEEANIYRAQALSHFYNNSYLIADSLFIKEINLYKNNIGIDNLNYATAMRLLANSYRSQTYYKDALDIYKYVIYILENDITIDNDHPHYAKKVLHLNNSIASTNSDLAYTYFIKSEFDSAEIHFEKALSYESFKTDDNYSETLKHRAYNSLFNGDYEYALNQFYSIKSSALKVHGKNSSYYINALNGIITANIILAKYDEAEKDCNEAISYYKDHQKSKGIRYIEFINSLSTIKYLQSDYDSALVLLNEAMIYAKENSTSKAKIFKSISRINGELSNYRLAVYQAQKASSIIIGLSDNKENRYISDFIRNEAYINYLIGDYENSEKLYQKCYKIDIMNNLNDKIDHASTFNGIALLRIEESKYEIADTLLRDALSIYKNVLGENHPEYATVIYNKAYLLFKQNKLDESEKLFLESINIIRKAFNNKHVKVADSYFGIGDIYIKLKDYKTALSYFQRASVIYNDKFKKEHQKVILTQKSIDLCKRKIN